jgi:hypothetical protein
MLDLILYILLGLAVIALSVWGGIVSAKSLPEGENKMLHISGFIACGVVAFVLTVVVGLRSYYAQKDDLQQQTELKETLKEQVKIAVETKATLDQSRLDQAEMKGNLQGQLTILGEVMSKWSNDSNQNMKDLGVALLHSQTLSPTLTNRYQTMSAGELKQEALNIAQQVRALEGWARTNEDALTPEWMYLKTDQERSQYTQKEMQIYTTMNLQYGGCCKSQGHLIRDEIIRREHLTPDPKNYIEFTYDNPTNPLGLEAVASDLQKLALTIPDEKPKQQHLP